MRKEALSFLHDSNAKDDEKIMRLRLKYGENGHDGMAAVGVFWSIIEIMREASGYKIELRDIDIIEHRLQPTNIQTKDFIENCINEDIGLFKTDGEYFWSESLFKRMENFKNAKTKKSLAGRKGSSVKWDKMNDNYEYTNIRSKRLAEARGKGRHTKEEWEKMKSFFKNCCVFCGGEVVDGPIKDHIIPIYQGGSDGIDNIQPACRGCNSSKGSDSTDMRIQYCEESGLKMPDEWLPMHYQCTDLLKEKKGKEEYNRTKQNTTKDNIRRLKELFNSEIYVKTGKDFSLIEEYVKDIIARQSEGHKLSEFIKIIDVKLIDPHFIKNPQFVNPNTLFRQPNFDKYRNQSIEDFQQKESQPRKPRGA
jgi:uncharacterized phage protein (TIGR02220 family)